LAAMKALLRTFSYFFHGLLALFLLAIALVALSSREPLHLPMLPWHGQALSYWLLGCGAAGLVLVFLAVRGAWRGLFFLWSLAVLVVMVRGFFFSSYHFAGPRQFHHALYWTAAALIATWGAWSSWNRTPAY
jgi:hypothetical protein